MFKFVLTAIFLGLLICLLYHPIALPDDDSIDKYRPSYKLQPTLNKTNQFKKTNLEIAIPDFPKDSIILKGSQTLVDSAP